MNSSLSMRYNLIAFLHSTWYPLFLYRVFPLSILLLFICVTFRKCYTLIVSYGSILHIWFFLQLSVIFSSANLFLSLEPTEVIFLSRLFPFTASVNDNFCLNSISIDYSPLSIYRLSRIYSPPAYFYMFFHCDVYFHCRSLSIS